MEENSTVPANNRNLALPVFLLVPVFFILYILALAWLLSGTLRSGLELFFPFSTASMLAGFFPYASCGLALLLSSAGAVLFFMELKARPVLRNPALLLCAVFGVMVSCSVISVILPSPDIQKYAGIIVLIGYASVPLCLAWIMDGIGKEGSGPTGTGRLRSLALLVGFFGLSCALLLAYSTLTYVPPAPDPRTDNMFNFDPLALFGTFFGLIDLAFLMPAVGILVLRFAVRLQRTPREINEPETGPGQAREKNAGPVFPVIRRPLTPPLRWTIVLLVLLLLAAGGYCAYGMFIDTTPGKTWTKVTASAPFGSKGGFAAAEYKGKLWLVGGTGYQGPSGEAWETPDGVTWTRESSPDMVPQRIGASAVVFKDALWIIGGTTEKSLILNNDVWYSGNGMNWSQIQPSAAFLPRNGHSITVFRDRLWLIGGNQGTETNNLTSDIWYSDDGISWRQATPAAEFSPRSGHAVFVYRDRLWLIGGWDATGNLNDVWSSGDGIHWTQATASAAFARGCPANAVVFDDRMWVIQNFYVTDPGHPWITDRSRGIWYSTDGITWTKLLSSPEFFQEEYSGGPPLPIVFDNRLWVLQWHNSDTGIWYTVPGGQSSCRPTADISADKITGPAPLTVEFSDASFCRPDQWQWDFGDGTQSTEQNPKHTFASPGNYSVSLVAKNNAGENWQSVNITVFKSLSVANDDAGKRWTRVTDKFPFGSRGEYTLTVWHDAMWVIAGERMSGYTGYNDTWYSKDGAHWTQATKNAEFEGRVEHNAVVYDDKLWVIGGITDYLDETGYHHPTIKNDTWYSTDGVTWIMAAPSQGFPPSRYTKSIVFSNRIWLFGQYVFYSDDSIHWNHSSLSPLGYYNELIPVVKDNRMWVLQHYGEGGFWSTADGITKTNATLPSWNNEEYSVYTESLIVHDNTFWLIRALEKREGRSTLRGELWRSDDGYNWVLVTDSLPFAEGAVGINDLHLIEYDNKIWAYMDRLTAGPFSERWDENFEIWYTE
jgi:PKD repeat protein